MHVTLITEKIFTLKIGVQTYPGMRQVSEWECFVKLESAAHGMAIIGFTGSATRQAFAEIFGNSGQDYSDSVIIFASGEILEAVKHQHAVNLERAQGA